MSADLPARPAPLDLMPPERLARCELPRLLYWLSQPAWREKTPEWLFEELFLRNTRKLKEQILDEVLARTRAWRQS